ncbi:GNAT family N-acetyltransferase [Rathayibacter sp. VKM Ac-2762]|uniref:GNAT family N-acetyltransferase n=1 Tax=Rathayibacter sp. VKM Ac-2762 TaxID=2609254 RepID=UPI003264C2A4
MIPAATARLRFREMTAEDLPDMADLLGDPVVMRYYPAPKDREQAAAWIEWTGATTASTASGCGSSRPSTASSSATAG